MRVKKCFLTWCCGAVSLKVACSRSDKYRCKKSVAKSGEVITSWRWWLMADFSAVLKAATSMSSKSKIKTIFKCYIIWEVIWKALHYANKLQSILRFNVNKTLSKQNLASKRNNSFFVFLFLFLFEHGECPWISDNKNTCSKYCSNLLFGEWRNKLKIHWIIFPRKTNLRKRHCLPLL